MRQQLLGLDLDKVAHIMSYHTVFRLFNQVKSDAKFFQAIIWFPGLPWKWFYPTNFRSQCNKIPRKQDV